MVNLTVEELQALMRRPDNIRNVSLLSQSNHGKDSVLDCLIAHSGVIMRSYSERYYCCRDEIDRTPTVKATYNILCYLRSANINYLINVTQHDDSPTSPCNMSVTDGALLVVDAVQGPGMQLQSQLLHMGKLKVRPVLFVNKLDVLLLDAANDAQAICRRLQEVVNTVSQTASMFEVAGVEQSVLNPVAGNVVFGSAKQCWAFSLGQFATFHHKQFNVSEKRMTQLLWGDHYFDEETQSWTDNSISNTGVKLKRGFVQLILKPIMDLLRAITLDIKDDLAKILLSLDLKLSKEEQQTPKDRLFKAIMKKWLSLPKTVLEMMVEHLPSPKVAQRYRIKDMYSGPCESPSAVAMQNCDPNGSLMIYIVAMVPTSDRRLLAFGRVLSGTATPGTKVSIMDRGFKHGSKAGCYQKSFQRIVALIGRNIEHMPEIPCGNFVAIIGLDAFVNGICTITNAEEKYPFYAPKPAQVVVKLTVGPKHPVDLPKLIDGMRKLSKVDQCIRCLTEETGQLFICGISDYHLARAFENLQNEYANCSLVRSDTIAIYKETITMKTGTTLLAKSPNKHNRLYGYGEPLEERLIRAIEAKTITSQQSSKQRETILCKDFDWQTEEATKIWAFGPEDNGTNLLVDMTAGAPFINEIRDSLVGAWQWASKNGVLIEEEIRGYRFNLTDCELMSDAIHRGGGQIMPTARRLYYACELDCSPNLLEPIYMCEITCTESMLASVQKFLQSRKGQVIEEQQLCVYPLRLVRANLPVVQTFSFEKELQKVTGGNATSQCCFDHWQTLSDLPFSPGSIANQLVLEIRKRKGLRQQLPNIDDFRDKL